MGLIHWTRDKKIYDAVLFVGIILYLAVFFIAHIIQYDSPNVNGLLLRATGTLAFLLLFIILSIGPLARLNNRFNVLLYNRRHLGVTMFFISLIHGFLSINYYHGFGDQVAIQSLFTANTDFSSIAASPYMWYGFIALIILFLMALTSHDFWLKKLSPSIWKGLHMCVYIVYLLVFLHLMAGLFQDRPNMGSFLFFGGLWTVVAILHLWAAFKGAKELTAKKADEMIPVATLSEVPDDHAIIKKIKNQEIAIFKNDGRLYAIKNYCAHQGGPLGEGKIVEGCITCPWHGYQYLAHNGTSPPPFDEKVPTYALSLKQDQIYVDPTPCVLGTTHEGVLISDSAKEKGEPLYIGWSTDTPRTFKKTAKWSALIFFILLTLSAGLMPHILQPLKNSTYSISTSESYKGTFIKYPVPLLRVNESGKIVDYPLVATFKFSALSQTDVWENGNQQSLDQAVIELSAHRIQLDHHVMLQLDDPENNISMIREKSSLPIIVPKNQSSKTLKGEIIDPKCYFGAMNPGEGKLHKSCAIRCLSGGIPAMIIAEEFGIKTPYFILDQNGKMINDDLLKYAAETVQLNGMAYTMNNWKYIELDKTDIKQLSFRKILGNSIGSDLCSVSLPLHSETPQ